MLSQIATYHIFNCLVPGAIFVYLSRHLLSVSPVPSLVPGNDVVTGLILSYFVGLILSKVGSLIIEPLLRYIEFIKYKPYRLYVEASGLDGKINTISEENNACCTYCSLCVSLIFLKIYEYMKPVFGNYAKYEFVVILITLLFLFLFSYRKQTEYIRKRINIALDKEEGENHG